MSAAGAERTALKEWAVVVDAMGRGEIVSMVRKGGIREQRAGFSVRHTRFLLYPTFFHEQERDLAPRFQSDLARHAVHATRPGAGTIRFRFVAEPVAVWQVDVLDSLRAIEGEHGLSWPAVESRFHYRNRPGVQVVAARVSALENPVEVAEAGRYSGCVSWVELDADVDVTGAQPVLPLDLFEQRLGVLCNALGNPMRP